MQIYNFISNKILYLKITNSSDKLAVKFYFYNPLCPGGGIGRRVGLKHQWGNPCRFDPGPGYKIIKKPECFKMNNKKQDRYDFAYLKLALEWANLSYCKRKKVGALIVKDKMIISDGYNGSPSGFNNECEDEDGNTHWYVLHAEANAILKTAKSNHDCSGATLYLTHSPCKECSKLIHQSGIKRLVYLEKYKDISGLNFLTEAGVKIREISKEELSTNE